MLIGEIHGNSNHELTKSISSSGKDLFIDFKKQEYYGIVQILAAIKYKKMNSDCQTWIDFETNVLKTPANLNTYNNNNINCHWLITTNLGYHISLKFTFMDVIFH